MVRDSWQTFLSITLGAPPLFKEAINIRVYELPTFNKVTGYDLPAICDIVLLSCDCRTGGHMTDERDVKSS